MTTKITTRQDKIATTIARLRTRLEKFECGGYDKSYEKMYGCRPTRGFVVPVTCGNRHDYDVVQYEGKSQPQWKYYRDCAKHELLEQIRNNEAKLEQAKRLDEKEQAAAAKKNDREIQLSLIPECLKQFAKRVEAATIEDKIRIHNYLRTLPYPKYNDRTKEANAIRRDRVEWDEEKVRRQVKRDVEDLVLDLVYRVRSKCGNIISTSNLHIDYANRGCTINGFVEGDKGNARVESIFAGGYNIQCLHVRVLVK